MADEQQVDVDKVLAERFTALPKVVQDAIVSADLSKHLRALSDTHNLHVDQWQALQNEVMLTLLGVQEISTLADDIASSVGVPADVAASLAQDISREVFEPIREQLERELGSVEAKTEGLSDIEAMRVKMLAEARIAGAEKPLVSEAPAPVTPAPLVPQAPIVAPSTPPAATPTDKAVRAPLSSSYMSQAASHERKSVEGDPYREQLK